MTLNTYIYTNLADSLREVKKIIDIDTNNHDTLLINWLELSKGIQYRPFIVAAYYLNIKPPRNGLKKTTGNDGAEWIDYKNLIKSFLTTQLTLDCNDTTIDRCWRVEFVYQTITGEKLPIMNVDSYPNFMIV